jgi:hypothetical protein
MDFESFVLVRTRWGVRDPCAPAASCFRFSIRGYLRSAFPRGLVACPPSDSKLGLALVPARASSFEDCLLGALQNREQGRRDILLFPLLKYSFPFPGERKGIADSTDA